MTSRLDRRLVGIGTAGGTLSGLLGVGGGVVMVPLLVLWAGFRQRVDAALQEHLPSGFYSAGIAERFLSRLHYVPMDINDPGSFARLA